VVVGDGDRRKVGIVEVDAADFLDGCSVEVDDAIFDFQRISWQGDDPLNPSLPAILGVEEGYEVIVPGLAVSVAVFADEDFVTFIEIWAHRVAGHGEDVEKVFANGESEAGDEGQREEDEGDINGKTVVVFEAVVISAGERHSTSVPCRVCSGDDCENGESDEDSLRWGGLGREEEYDYGDHSRDCAEMKKAATKGTAVNLSETG
jgi:hypothetical protein